MSLLHLRPFDVTDPVSRIRVCSKGPSEEQEETPAGVLVIRYVVSIYVVVWDALPGPLKVPVAEIETRESFVRLAMRQVLTYHPKIVPFCCVRHRLVGMMDALSCSGLNPEFEEWR
jgi:hypothetical protein